MITLIDAYSIFCAWLLWGGLLMLLPPIRLSAGRYVLLALIPVMFVPLDQSALWSLTRGAVHDLSLPAVILLANHVMLQSVNRPLLKAQTRELLMLLIAGLGIVFYPMTLGMTQLDPYIAGYESPMAALVVVVALCLWLVKRYELAAVLALAVCAWTAGILDSNNLWDYLVDPLVFCVSCVWFLWRTGKRLLVSASENKAS